MTSLVKSKWQDRNSFEGVDRLAAPTITFTSPLKQFIDLLLILLSNSTSIMKVTFEAIHRSVADKSPLVAKLSPRSPATNIQCPFSRIFSHYPVFFCDFR